MQLWKIKTEDFSLQHYKVKKRLIFTFWIAAWSDNLATFGAKPLRETSAHFCLTNKIDPWEFFMEVEHWDGVSVRACACVHVRACVCVCDTVTQPVGGLSSTSKDSASLECEQTAGPSSSFTTRLDINKRTHPRCLHIHTHNGMQDELCLWTDKLSFHARCLSNHGFLLHMRKKVSIEI